MGLDHLERRKVTSFLVAGAPVRPFPEFFKSAHNMDAQFLAHPYAVDIGVESRNCHVWMEPLRRDAVHDLPEPPDIVTQGFACILLQPVQVVGGCRWSRVAGLEVMCVMAFHLFSSVAPGVDVGARAPGALSDRVFTMRVVEKGSRKRTSFSRDCICSGFSTNRRWGIRGGVTLVDIVQEALQTCDPCSSPRVALALFRWE